MVPQNDWIPLRMVPQNDKIPLRIVFQNDWIPLRIWSLKMIGSHYGWSLKMIGSHYAWSLKMICLHSIDATAVSNSLVLYHIYYSWTFASEIFVIPTSFVSHVIFYIRVLKFWFELSSRPTNFLSPKRELLWRPGGKKRPIHLKILSRILNISSSPV